MMNTAVETVTAAAQPVETWAAIPNYKFLEASTEGRIRSFRQPDKVTGLPYRILSTPPSDNGYLLLSSQADDTGRAVTRHVHKLVALTFLGPKPEGMIVLHKNDRPDDNRVSNLAYGTYAQNYADSIANGGRYMGPDPVHWGKGAKLSVSDVWSMRRKFADGARICDLVAEYGVSRGAVAKVVRGKSFAWVGADSAETAKIRARAEAQRDMAKATIRLARSSHTPPAAAPVSKGWT